MHCHPDENKGGKAVAVVYAAGTVSCWNKSGRNNIESVVGNFTVMCVLCWMTFPHVHPCLGSKDL